jgi:hypothetical protein
MHLSWQDGYPDWFFLCVASSTGTIHVFNYNRQGGNLNYAKSSWKSMKLQGESENGHKIVTMKSNLLRVIICSEFNPHIVSAPYPALDFAKASIVRIED